MYRGSDLVHRWIVRATSPIVLLSGSTRLAAASASEESTLRDRTGVRGARTTRSRRMARTMPVVVLVCVKARTSIVYELPPMEARSEATESGTWSGEPSASAASAKAARAASMRELTFASYG